jgi:putative transport protein
MGELLQTNSLLLLFLVAAIGYFLGTIKIKGNSLGVSAVLFVGLAFGAINPEFNAPDILFQLGLVFFVYSIGLSSGPAFFNSFKTNGWRDFSFVLIMLTLSAIVAAGLFFLFDFSSATITGIYAGSTTNTPALASVIELVSNSDKYLLKDDLINQLAVGYSYSYPMGVLGVMIAIKLMEKLLKVDYDVEKKELRKIYPIDENLTSRTIKVTKSEATGMQLRDLVKDHGWKVVFGRIDAVDDGISLANWDKKLKIGDRIIAVGSGEEVLAVQEVLGEEAEEHLSENRKDFDVRRIFVSNHKVVGQKLSALNISQNYHAIITRIRRGDIDFLARGNTVLELGDRIRFVARRKDLDALAKLFGDSYYASSRVNIFSFGLGIAIGLLIGTIQFSLGSGISFKLGYAGGPLIVGLIFGALRRTGPIVWTLPYSANVTLRQIGLMLVLAVIGLKSGNTFINSLQDGQGLIIFAGGTIVALFTTTLSIFLGYKLMKIPFSLLLGFVSNQPAILDFTVGISRNRVPLIGYSLMFPISVVMKILYAQLLFLFLQ